MEQLFSVGSPSSMLTPLCRGPCKTWANIYRFDTRLRRRSDCARSCSLPIKWVFTLLSKKL
uniref:Uncharacterized protein n=1 Tax=Parascaris equorum TaxID=6256 RepID=A0A914RV05_PAREQ